MEKFEIKVLKRAEIKKTRERFPLKSFKTRAYKSTLKFFVVLLKHSGFPISPVSMAITLK